MVVWGEGEPKCHTHHSHNFTTGRVMDNGEEGERASAGRSRYLGERGRGGLARCPLPPPSPVQEAGIVEPAETRRYYESAIGGSQPSHTRTGWEKSQEQPWPLSLWLPVALSGQVGWLSGPTTVVWPTAFLFLHLTNTNTDQWLSQRFFSFFSLLGNQGSLRYKNLLIHCSAMQQGFFETWNILAEVSRDLCEVTLQSEKFLNF